MYMYTCTYIHIYICMYVLIYLSIYLTRVNPLTRSHADARRAQLERTDEHTNCARVVAGRYYKRQQISTTLTRFRPLFGLHDRQLRQLSRGTW